MTTSPTQLVVPVSPRLPSAADDYSIQHQNALNKALADYFGMIDGVQSSLLGPQGARFLDAPYGIFSSSSDQTTASSTAVNAVTFSSFDAGSGMTLVTSTKLTVLFPGLFDFVFLIQLQNGGAAAFDQYFWLRKNGTDVPNSAHRFTVQVGAQRVTLDFPIQLVQGDYVELMWNSASTAVILKNNPALTSPVPVPAIPSAYANVQFMTASNSSSTDTFIPPAPPAPAPTPAPPAPSTPPPPAPPPPAPAPPPGTDTSIAAIFSGGASGSWWYPANDSDRALNPDGSGGTVTTDTAVFQYLADHSGNGRPMVYPGPDKLNYRTGPPEYCEVYHEANALSTLGGSTTGFAFVMTFQLDAGTWNTIFSDVTGAATTATNGVFLHYADDGLLRFSAGTGSGRAEVTVAMVEGASATPHVVLGWIDLTAHTINMVVDNGSVVSATCSGLSAGSSAMSVWANPFADFSFGGWEGWDHFFGRFYGGVIIKNSALTSSQRTDLLYWGGAQANISLPSSTPPPPPPPAPAPPPAPSPGIPAITMTGDHLHDFLQSGNPGGGFPAYWTADDRWGVANANLTEGTASYQYQQSVERSLVTGANGEVGMRFKWYYPQFDQNGQDISSTTGQEVKAYPTTIYGAKPGFGSSGTQWPAFDLEVRLPDGATVPVPPPGTPGPIAAAWNPLGGSVGTVAPADSTPNNVLPFQLPTTAPLFVTFRWAHLSTPTGVGHLSFDIWLQSQSGQTANGHFGAPITHEVMVDVCNWGNYGTSSTVNNAPWSRSGFWYVHDVTIGGTLYHLHAAKDYPSGNLTSDFGGLSGAYTDEETGSGRTGWKYIVYVPNLPHPQDATGLVSIDISGLLNHLLTVNDARGIPFVLTTPPRYLVSIEIGIEPVYGSGDLVVYDYKIGNSVATPPAPPPPPPPPAPAPAPGTAPFYPFGSRIDNNATTGAYNFGIQPTNYTKAQMDARVITAYNGWKANRLKSAPTFVANSNAASGLAGVTITDGLYDSWGGGSIAYVSEGQGYGLLIAVLMAGYDTNAQSIFDRLFKVARARPAYGMGTSAARQYTMDWQVGVDMGSLGGGFSAPDGDLDMALALLMAERQWGNGGTFNYGAEAVNTINALKGFYFTGSGTPLSPQNGSRTSDYMPGHFRAFKVKTGDAFWDTVRTRCATLITNIISGFSPTAKLQPGFIYDPDGVAVPAYAGHGDVDRSGLEGTYDSNAIRNPWRWGTDFVLSGDAVWGNFANGNTTWIKNDSGGDPFNTAGNFNLDGTGYAGRYLAGVTAVSAGVGGMVSSSHQAYLNAMFTAISDNYSVSYFDAEIELLSLIVMSGNWWKPA